LDRHRIFGHRDPGRGEKQTKVPNGRSSDPQNLNFFPPGGGGGGKQFVHQRHGDGEVKNAAAEREGGIQNIVGTRGERGEKTRTLEFN